MAGAFGELGWHVSRGGNGRQRSIWALCIVGIAAVGTILGFVVCDSVPWFTVRPLSAVLFSVALLLGLCLVGAWTFRRTDELERERKSPVLPCPPVFWQQPEPELAKKKNAAAVELGRLGGLRSGKSRARKALAERRRHTVVKAVKARRTKAKR